MVDDALVARAVEILRSRLTARQTIELAREYLEEHPPFGEMEDAEIDEIAAAAIGRLPLRASTGPSRPLATVEDRRRPPANLVPSAPFRFVLLPDEVALAAFTARDEPIAGGFCATLAVEWAAETPLLIGAADREDVVVPLRLGTSGSDYVIPGATLRGMIRAAVEIVAHGRLGSANLHHRYGLRDFEHPAYVERSPVSRVCKVKAGWLEQTEGGLWQITPCEWAHVPIESLLQTNYGRWDGQQRARWIQRSLADKYEAVGMKRGDVFDFRKAFGFSDPHEENGRKLVSPAGIQEGTLVFSGRLPGAGGNKRFEYAFFAPAGAPVMLKPEIVESFERLYSRPSKNKPTPDGSWRVLKPTLEGGGRLPVFLVGDLDRQDENFFFGLTRLFKVPHERSVGEVLAAQPNHIPPRFEGDDTAGRYSADFVENLFGYVVEPDRSGPADLARVAPEAVGLKGRVAFSFAHLLPGQSAELSDPISTIMMAPRASFAPFYLKSAAEKDYSADRAPRLAGRKRYLPRRRNGGVAGALGTIQQMGHNQIERARASSRSGRISEEVQTRLRFLLPTSADELCFASTIRMHNVTAAELGAVLFALTHAGDPAKPYRHMIGRAKPFGAGQLRVVSARLSVEPNDAESDLVQAPTRDEIASADGRRGFCPPPAQAEPAAGNASHVPFLDAFVRRMREIPGLTAFPDVPAVREFLGACDPGEAERLNRTLDYLPLDAFNQIRRAVKPLRQQGRTAAPAPAVFPGERDGRLLASPIVSRQFWRWGPGRK